MDQGPRGQRASLLAAALLLLAACASPAPPASRTLRPEPPTVRLHVENNSWSDLTIYAIRAGTRSRIGAVGSLEARDFKLGAATTAPGTVQLYAEPLAGGSGYHAPEISVGVSDRVELIVENHLALSKVLLSER